MASRPPPAPLRPAQAYPQAFDSWAATLQRKRTIARSSSVATYRDLWSLVSRWCLGQNPAVPLQQLRPEHLAALLQERAAHTQDGHELSARYVWRLLHLVDRVLQHHALSHGLVPNRAAQTLLASREDWQHANASARDPLPEHLDAPEARQLVNHLSRLGLAWRAAASAKPRADSPPAAQAGATPRRGRAAPDEGQADLVTALADETPWQDLRNRTAVALQLGAGLTPGEVRGLTLGDVAVHTSGRRQGLPWKLRLPARAQSPEHETPMAPWAARLLQQWLARRTLLCIPGPQLLPSTRTGKPWGKVAHYNAVTQVMQASGLPEALVPGGSFRLRHTFALRQLRRGRSPEEVARWLGLVDPGVLSRYQQVVFEPDDDLV